MESNKVSKICGAYGKTLNLVNVFGIVPYKWCKLHQKATYQPFKARWTIFLGLTAAVHQAFLVTQSIRGFRNRDSIPLFTLTRTFTVTFGYIICNHNFYAILKDPPFHSVTINGIILTAKRFYGGDRVRGRSATGLLAYMWMNRHIGFKILPTLLTLPMIWKPHLSYFYTSMLKDPMGSSLIVRLAGFLIQDYTSAISCGMLVYNVVTMVVCLFFITDMLGTRLSNTQNRRNSMGFKLKSIKLHMELSILVNCLNEIFREWMSGMEVFFGVVVIVNFTAAVLTGEPRMFITSALAFIALFYLISLSGNVFMLSQQLLHKNVSHGERRRSLVEKYRRAVRPLRIEFGQFFYADKYLMLTVLSAVLTNTANLLVSLRNP